MATCNSISPQGSSQAPSRRRNSRLKPIHLKFTAADVRGMLDTCTYSHSPAALARDIGITRDQLSKVLNGARPNARIARYFGLSSNFTVTYTD